MSDRSPADAPTVADAFLAQLAERGIDYLFANGGTDFAPIVEGFVKARAAGTPTPKPVTVPHENVAVAMAMGYYMMTGRPQAVMVHVNVGAANALCGLLNARRAYIPLLFASGRTPITESGEPASRNIHIHWTQEMFDQGGMLREAVKWDYELRTASQLATVVDRALAVASTEPKGPVYLSLPREVLAASANGTGALRAMQATPPAPPAADPDAIDRLAAMLAAAERPLIITTSLGLDPAAVPALAAVVERFAIPVVQNVPRCMSLPSDHPMHFGYDPAPLLAEADVVLCIESVVPWIPALTGPAPGAKVVQLAPDPLFSDHPIRGFPCDLGISGAAASSLRLLDATLAEREGTARARIDARRARLADAWTSMRAGWAKMLDGARNQRPIHPAWLTHCVNEAKRADSVVVREAPSATLPLLSSTQPRSYLAAGGAGGLGWGLGCAIGAKLAAPDRLVIACEGDGSYMFGVPVAAHYVAFEQEAPFLTVIYNNRRWNEVRAAAHYVYPDGHAARSNAAEPITYFDEALRLEKVVETVGGHGEVVTEPDAVPAALARAVRIVEEEKRQAVLNVICGP